MIVRWDAFYERKRGVEGGSEQFLETETNSNVVQMISCTPLSHAATREEERGDEGRAVPVGLSRLTVCCTHVLKALLRSWGKPGICADEGGP